MNDVNANAVQIIYTLTMLDRCGNKRHSSSMRNSMWVCAVCGVCVVRCVCAIIGKMHKTLPLMSNQSANQKLSAAPAPSHVFVVSAIIARAQAKTTD